MKKGNVFRLVLSVTFFSHILLLSGCWPTSSKPPSIPPGINAKLPTYGYGSRLNWSDSNDYDASALFYIDYFIQYAEQDKPGLISDWYIYKLNKIATIDGQFDEDEISFLCTISHSKPGARMQFDPVPIQYKRRMVLLLGLKKQDDHYDIVSQEQRSWLAPYGKLVKPEEVDNFKETVNAVCSYFNIDQSKFHENWELWLRNQASRYDFIASFEKRYGYSELLTNELKRLSNSASIPNIGNFEIVDENNEYYVIRVRTRKEKHLMINKTTFEVGPLPVPKIGV